MNARMQFTSIGAKFAIFAGMVTVVAADVNAQTRTVTPYEPQLDVSGSRATPPPAAAPPAAATSRPKISCFNAQRLKASLNEMIAPMSRAEQKTFMTGFFHYAYASRPAKFRPYGGVRMWGQVKLIELAGYSANGFLNDGRMDDMSPARAYTAYGKSSGYSAAASYNQFLDNFCPNVEGMDRLTLTALGSDQRCLRSLERHQQSRGILGRTKLAEGCALPVMPIGR